MIHSFLLIGQSNMAGRGFINEAEEIDTSRIKILRNGRWQPMFRPINPDRETSGVTLAESFASLYANEKNVDVGIIPCADGGSSLDQWIPGGLLFDNACYQTELASRTSDVAGVLWHQGESDCDNELFPSYKEKLATIIESFKERLNLYDVPFLLGGLGDFLSDYGLHNYIYVNEAIKKVSEENNMIGFVSAEGLTANPDNLHFSAKSLRIFGERYYKEFLKHEDKNKVYHKKLSTDSMIRNELEKF